MSYHIISYDYHITSYHIILYHAISYHYHIMSCHVPYQYHIILHDLFLQALLALLSLSLFLFYSGLTRSSLFTTLFNSITTLISYLIMLCFLAHILSYTVPLFFPSILPSTLSLCPRSLTLISYFHYSIYILFYALLCFPFLPLLCFALLCFAVLCLAFLSLFPLFSHFFIYLTTTFESLTFKLHLLIPLQAPPLVPPILTFQ